MALSFHCLNKCKSLTSIEFDEQLFVKPDQPRETREVQRRVFLDFIKCWIDNHRGTLVDKFSLRLSMPENVGEMIDECVVFATRHRVKELELDFADPSWNENNVYHNDYVALVKLPTRVYRHNSLESLKLYSCSFVETRVLNFHALKEVCLGWMEVKLTSIKALLTSCKMLESLSFKKCWNSDKFDLGEEQYMRLRKLVLDKCRFDFIFFKVNAPILKVFKYCGLMNFFTIEFHSLVMEEADLDFSPEYGFQGHGNPLRSLLEALSNVRVFTVCSFMLQVIPSGSELIRHMQVRHLIMKTALHENEFVGIVFFLNICPMLERLTIEICSEKDLFDYETPFNFERTDFWIDYVGVYECLSSSLKVVEINGFRGTSNEILVLNYFLINGAVLKKISINRLKDGSGRTVESDCLLTVEKASRNLEISTS